MQAANSEPIEEPPNHERLSLSSSLPDQLLESFIVRYLGLGGKPFFSPSLTDCLPSHLSSAHAMKDAPTTASADHGPQGRSTQQGLIDDVRARQTETDKSDFYSMADANPSSSKRRLVPFLLCSPSSAHVCCQCNNNVDVLTTIHPFGNQNQPFTNAERVKSSASPLGDCHGEQTRQTVRSTGCTRTNSSLCMHTLHAMGQVGPTKEVATRCGGRRGAGWKGRRKPEGGTEPTS